MYLKTRFAAPILANSERLTTTSEREGFVGMCARTDPNATGIGAVYFGRGGQTWPKRVLNFTHKHTLTDQYLFQTVHWQLA